MFYLYIVIKERINKLQYYNKDILGYKYTGCLLNETDRGKNEKNNKEGTV